MSTPRGWASNGCAAEPIAAAQCGMQPITFDRAHALHDRVATRQFERTASAVAGPHRLMQRAGLAVARLALALAPHAQRVWIACGPGNNGGDGLEAAVHLQRWGKHPMVQWLGRVEHLADDAAASLQRARAAGVAFVDRPPELEAGDLAIDALLGLGRSRPAAGDMTVCIEALNRSQACILAVDVPSGLDADTGAVLGPAVRAHHTLSLLTVKPGLFMNQGRDVVGRLWFDGLQAGPAPEPSALLGAPPAPHAKPHASHKGRFGDVAVIGGAPGMTGAATLAAIAALHAGAGRVYVASLGESAGAPPAPFAPELMWRTPAELPLSQLVVACGCGGGASVAPLLPRVMADAAQLVLDADALNALAQDTRLQPLLRQRRDMAVLTPHPLEAARLLGCQVRDIQADRLASAQALAEQLHSVVVLKGSGTVIAAPGDTPVINPTGNGQLATAGTGDVLAGLIAARIGMGESSKEAACHAVYQHGALADDWPADRALTALGLAEAAGRRFNPGPRTASSWP